MAHGAFRPAYGLIAARLSFFPMAGETEKTTGLVLRIVPWSRTSHVVTWLTADRGVVSTLVKGAVRPKSAFLGQYDLFYACEIVYYARGAELHPLREAVPLKLRERLRGRWRETTLAGYAADLVRQFAPAGGDASEWFAFLDAFLDRLEATTRATPADLVRLEMGVLEQAGLRPDFSGLDPDAEWTPFAVDAGRCGVGTRTVRLSAAVAACLEDPDGASSPDARADAVRFLGQFLQFHADLTPDVRRGVVAALTRN